MPTVQELANRTQSILDELTVLKQRISESLDISSSSIQKKVLQQSKVSSELSAEASMYDRLFEEEEAKRQVFGGKTRHQTLQEFVLLFFFVGFGVLTISLTLFVFTTKGQTDALKILGIMLFSLFIISALLIRYA